MTFGEMQSICRMKLNEASATFWADQDIKDALNEAYEEIADATEFYERQANISLLAGRTYYDLTSLLDTDTFLSPRRGFNVATNKWFVPADVRAQDNQTYVQWELTHGAPKNYFMRGNWWLGVWPKPNDDVSYKLRMYYTAVPPQFVNDRDEPLFPQQWHMGIVDIALSDLLGQERESKSAVAHWQAGQAYIASITDYVQGRQGLDRQELMQ